MSFCYCLGTPIVWIFFKSNVKNLVFMDLYYKMMVMKWNKAINNNILKVLFYFNFIDIFVAFYTIKDMGRSTSLFKNAPSIKPENVKYFKNPWAGRDRAHMCYDSRNVLLLGHFTSPVDVFVAFQKLNRFRICSLCFPCHQYLMKNIRRKVHIHQQTCILAKQNFFF